MGGAGPYEGYPVDMRDTHPWSFEHCDTSVGTFLWLRHTSGWQGMQNSELCDVEPTPRVDRDKELLESRKAAPCLN